MIFTFRLSYPSHPVSLASATTYISRDLAFSSLSTDKPTDIYVSSPYVSVCLDFSNVYAWMPDALDALNCSYQNFHVLCFLFRVHFLLVAGLLEQEESTKDAEAKGLLKISILDLRVNAVGM